MALKISIIIFSIITYSSVAKNTVRTNMVQVKISDGILEGEIIQNKYGGSFHSFKGIPYAQPPIGELRFVEPQPVKPWNGIRDAKKEGPMCSQHETFMFNKYMGQEDCLYLNVYTPDVKPAHLLPVMIWIYGGGFTCGSGNYDFYEPEFLIKNDVVIVSFNYRVGAFGFLCLNTKQVPGNAGMKDQVAVLRWVQKNIEKFGGNPSNVTIFGESAGAASVSYHLISPMSVGLFRRAILQSGAFTNSWSRSERPRERALSLARKLGCNSEDDNTLATFFKSVPMEDLIDIDQPITISEKYTYKIHLSFGIVNEMQFDDRETFFSQDDSENLKIQKNIDIIIGYNEHEGVMRFHSGLDVRDILYQANTFVEYFVPSSLTYKATLSDHIDIGTEIKKYYFQNDIITMENIDLLLNFCSTESFIYEIIALARMIAKNNNNNVYLYKFTCKSKRNIFTEKYGAAKNLGNDTFVCHADDLGYLFPLTAITPKLENNSNEYKMIQAVTALWTNFAKYGNPTPNDNNEVEWKKFTIENQEYLNIGNVLKSETYPEKEEISFWDTIYKKYFPEYFI